jgi:hypothetical protein
MVGGREEKTKRHQWCARELSEDRGMNEQIAVKMFDITWMEEAGEGSDGDGARDCGEIESVAAQQGVNRVFDQ